MKKQGLNLREKTKTVTMQFSVARRGKGFLQAKESVNCHCLDGTIRTLKGAAMMILNNLYTVHFSLGGLLDMLIMRTLDPSSKTYSRRLVYIIDSGIVYSQDKNSNGYSQLANVGAKMFSFNFMGKDGRAWAAILGQKTMVVVDDNFVCTELDFTTQYGAGCFYKNRLFVGVQPYCLAYSAPEEPTNFTESVHGGGLIRFTQVRGEVVAVVPFREALYVFFERGIAKVDVVGSPKDFKVTYLQYTGGTILFRTVGAGGSAIYFMTLDGLYRFDGEKTEAVLKDVVVPPTSVGGREKVVAWQGGVLIRYRKKYKEDALLWVRDDGKECCYLEDIDAISFDESDGILLRFSKVKIGKWDLKGESLGVKYRFHAETDFGLSERKSLRKLTFEGDGTFALTLQNGKRKFARTVSFQDGVATVNLSERGSMYAMTIEPQDGTVIKNVTAELHILD